MASLGKALPGANAAISTRPNLASSSFSTNDIPTLKNNQATALPGGQTHAEKHFQAHNANMGRIPANGVNNRISRDFASGASINPITATAGGDTRREEPINGLKALQSDMQANTMAFGPTTSAGSPAEAVAGVMSPPAMNQFTNPAFYGGYGMQMMNMGMNPMQMAAAAGMGPFAGQMGMFQGQGGFAQYPPYNQMGRFQDVQSRAVPQRRVQNVDGECCNVIGRCYCRNPKLTHLPDGARFHNAKIETFKGEILSLCKDQHGCRYLQKQLETRKEETVQIIFMEAHPHVIDLMTGMHRFHNSPAQEADRAHADPFGNYLCQKLLEHCNDSQRTMLVNSTAPQMVKVALNQHGTRALQKMIEHLSTPEQIQTVIAALKDHVVELIQDLNGNHVIQKCLNRLVSQDFQVSLSRLSRLLPADFPAVHLRGCRRQLRRCRLPPPRMLRHSALHRPRHWNAEDRLGCCDHRQRIRSGSRPVRQLCTPVHHRP